MADKYASCKNYSDDNEPKHLETEYNQANVCEPDDETKICEPDHNETKVEPDADEKTAYELNGETKIQETDIDKTKVCKTDDGAKEITEKDDGTETSESDDLKTDSDVSDYQEPARFQSDYEVQVADQYANFEDYNLTILIEDEKLKKEEITKMLPPFLKHTYKHEQLLFDLDLHFQGTEEIALREKLLKATSGPAPCPVPLLLDLISLRFNALNGLPGVFTPSFLKKMTSQELCKLLDGFDDKSAQVWYCLGLMEASSEIFVIQAGLSGTMRMPKDPELFGWECCFIPDGYDKPYEDLTRTELRRSSYRRMSLIILSNYYRRDYQFPWNRAYRKAKIFPTPFMTWEYVERKLYALDPYVPTPKEKELEEEHEKPEPEEAGPLAYTC